MYMYVNIYTDVFKDAGPTWDLKGGRATQISEAAKGAAAGATPPVAAGPKIVPRNRGPCYTPSVAGLASSAKISPRKKRPPMLAAPRPPLPRPRLSVIRDAPGLMAHTGMPRLALDQRCCSWKHSCTSATVPSPGR